MKDKKPLILITSDENRQIVRRNFELYDFSIEKIIDFVELIETLEGMEG